MMEFDEESTDKYSSAAPISMPHLPLFPYMIIREYCGVYHRVLLENDTEEELISKVKAHPALRQFKCCLVLGTEDCIYFTPDGGMKRSSSIPEGGFLIEEHQDRNQVLWNAFEKAKKIEKAKEEEKKKENLIACDKSKLHEKATTQRENVTYWLDLGDKGWFTNKPLEPINDEEWVEYVKDGEGVKVITYGVVVKVRSINEKYKGGWDGFVQFCRDNRYPLIYDNRLTAAYDRNCDGLACLIASLGENGLQAEHGPVDYYVMFPYGAAMDHYTFKDYFDSFFSGTGIKNDCFFYEAINTFNDYEIEITLDESTEAIKVSLRENNWQKYNRIYNKAIDLYKLGDIMGSGYEGGSVFYKPHTFEEIKKKMRSGFRTDESDIVDCFNNFISDYRFRGKIPLLMDWVVYHSTHRSHVRYGKTYNEHFQIVGTLKSHDNLTLKELFSLAADKGSFGNACLALVYPVYHYAETLNRGRDERCRLIIDFCRLTHPDPNAISAVTLLFAIIDMSLRGENIFDPKSHEVYSKYYSPKLKKALHSFLTGNINLIPEDFIQKYPNNIMALNTLFYALYAVRNASTVEEVATIVISFCGDADSVNATALMIWGILLESSTERIIP